ncbi:carbamoyl phosphate synthase small subunit [Bacillus fonticola]|uniref:carbamoyl phosphate synthase small subunit n=1 Tax=Bacillus fonticola TaxID=2728853 RepID=UPI001474617F|nr:carbamoyl phosphate synthase small subunit [Bacillus fonticola]
MNGNTGYLVLSTGDVLEGKWLGEATVTEGEMVFNTAMTGYQEVMTDPSYAGQIVTMTYPLIGNYGCNDLHHESIKPSLAGLIVAYPCHAPEHYQSRYSLVEMVNRYQIPTLYDLDTRALTTIIREHGEVFGKITSSKLDTPQKLAVDANLVRRVSVTEIVRVKAKNFVGTHQPHVVVVDFGYKHSIVHTLVELGCDVTVVPFNSTATTIHQLHPDGVVLSNGPGNPEDAAYIIHNIRQITEDYPTLGICLGHQLVALAYGGKTKRLPFGHRGNNHPVKNTKTGKVSITSQNHGYVVNTDSLHQDEWQASYIHINDRSVEGLIHKQKPITTVQFHPEAHPGPDDTQHIFTDFIDQITNKEKMQHA